jgi:lantibiotic modifying enzyme
MGNAASAAHEFDLLGGRAGAIVGLITLSRLLDRQDLVDQAARLADDLVSTADVRGPGHSWSSPSSGASRNLAGLSHGAAGAGLALLELAAVTGDDSYGRAARGAFQYERSLFDRDAQNWPDLRGQRGSARQGPYAPAFPVMWCHGAAGIALSRLRAVELIGDPACREEALVAVETTKKTVANTLLNRSGNYSLCHGLAGNAEVLLYAREVLGGDWEDGARLAFDVAEAGVEHYGAHGRPWPCGTFEGETAGLFLGLAGIGLFYLRLHDPLIPSVLLFRHEAFRPGLLVEASREARS